MRRTSSSDPGLAAVALNAGNGSISVSPAALSRRDGTCRHPPTECAEAVDGATPHHSGYGTISVANISLRSGIQCEFMKIHAAVLRICAPRPEIADDTGLLFSICYHAWSVHYGRDMPRDRERPDAPLRRRLFRPKTSHLLERTPGAGRAD